jgi:hypothetical protein
MKAFLGSDIAAGRVNFSPEEMSACESNNEWFED